VRGHLVDPSVELPKSAPRESHGTVSSRYMAYRSDLEALAARESALQRELAEKQGEHRDVGRMLDEARADEARTSSERNVRGRRRMRYRAAVILGLLVSSAAVGSIVIVKRRAVPTPSRAGLSCAAVEPAYRAFENVADGEFRSALAIRSLAPITLETRLRDAWAPVTEEEIEREFGQPITAWHPFTYAVDGSARQAVMSSTYELPTPKFEFAKDSSGGVWLVRRAPSWRSVMSVTVYACDWGCWGRMPSGAHPGIGRGLWLLPVASTFRGEVTIEFDAPTLGISYVHSGDECMSPP